MNDKFLKIERTSSRMSMRHSLAQTSIGRALPVSMVQVVTTIAALAAAIVALVPPLVFFAISYDHQQKALMAEATYNAEQITGLIARGQEPWVWHRERIAAIISLSSLLARGYLHAKSVTNRRGEIIAATRVAIAPPHIAVAVPLLDDERQVGEIRIESTLRPLVASTALVLLASLACGGATFAGVRLLPLRALNTALGDLRCARERAEAERAAAIAARNEAELANRTKTEFLANMSHELRTPLNAILGFSEVIRDALLGPVDPRSREYARDIHASGQHLLSMINEVLDLSRVEAGRLELLEEPINARKVIMDCCQFLREEADRSGVALEATAPSDLPIVMADELRLKQIFLNLLSNAVKFTPQGGRVTVSTSSPASGGLCISIADTGVGMTPEQIPIALEPFRQINGAFTRRCEGSGLGLPLARRLVEIHGGRLEIDSKPRRRHDGPDRASGGAASAAPPSLADAIDGAQVESLPNLVPRAVP